MASNIPTRKAARAMRTENMVPQDDSQPTARLAGKEVAGRVFGRAKTDSKLVLPSKSSTLLAPTASSKAKSVASDLKGEKRKREALVDRSDKNALKPAKLLASNIQRKTAAKPLAATARARNILNVQPKRDSTTHLRQGSNESNKMQVCDEYIHDIDDREDDLEPAPKRQHTLTPPLIVPTDEAQFRLDADEVARQLQAVAEEEEEEGVQSAAQGQEPESTQQRWIDLDAEDWDDPTSVSEYVAEVHEYLKKMETDVLPSPTYIDDHPKLEWHHRRQTLNWCFAVHTGFHLQNETWFLAVNIFDRFLSTRQIHYNKIQLVGLVSLFIAAKFEETYVPSVAHMVQQLATDEEAESEEAMRKLTDTFMTAERYVLQTVGWDLRYPSPMGWLRRGSKADDLDDKVRLVGKYLMDVATMDERLVGVRPSVLASTALWLGRLMFKKPEWTPTLIHYTSCTEEEMITTGGHILEMLLQGKKQFPYVFHKYANKKLSKASVFCDVWVQQRWPQHSRIDLRADLPELKRDIEIRLEERRQRKAAERAAGYDDDEEEVL